MKQQALNLIFSISVVLMMVLDSPSVNAASYIFSQKFSGGGLVTGSFSGEDTSGAIDQYGTNHLPDGLIASCSASLEGFCHDQFGGPSFSELTSFSIHFSGNSFFRKLDQLPSLVLYLFIFEKHGKYSYLGLDYGTNFRGGDASQGFLTYTPGSNPCGEVLCLQNIDTGEFIASHAVEGLSVTQTPLPGALILFATGLASLLGLVRHKTIP